MQEKEIVTIGFDHNDKHYVIKVFHVGNKYTIKRYLNDMLINSYSYPVEPDNMDGWKFHYGDLPPYARLVEILVHDIKEGNGLKKDT